MAQFSDSSDIKLRLTFSRANLLEVGEEAPSSGASFFELQINKQLNGSKDFHRYYGYPEIGIAIQYGDWGNPEQYGYNLAVYPAMRLNIRRDKIWGAYFKIGIGFSYFNKPYDRHTNPYNNIIGSHITNITTIGGGLTVRPTKKLECSAGYSLLHYSNGHSKVPNLGGNFLPLNFSLAYKPNQTEYIHKPHKNEVRPVRMNFRFGTGTQEWYGSTYPVDGPSYRVWNFSPHLSKRVGKISDIHWGVSLSWYQQFYEFMHYYDFKDADKFSNACVVSVFTGHEFLLNRFSGLLEIGITVHNPIFEQVHVYNVVWEKPPMIERFLQARAGMLYYIYKPNDNKHNAIAAGMFIKSNGAKADYVEYFINYSL